MSTEPPTEVFNPLNDETQVLPVVQGQGYRHQPHSVDNEILRVEDHNRGYYVDREAYLAFIKAKPTVSSGTVLHKLNPKPAPDKKINWLVVTVIALVIGICAGLIGMYAISGKGDNGWVPINEPSRSVTTTDTPEPEVTIPESTATTEEPSTSEPETTVEPTTPDPSTIAPTTEEATTDAPTTEPDESATPEQTADAVTESPSTEPTTEEPSTNNSSSPSEDGADLNDHAGDKNERETTP